MGYFITTYSKIETSELGWSYLVSARTPGYYETFEDAEDTVLNNICDIWEYCYNYAIIENISPGLYMYDTEPKFYEYNQDTNGYEPMERPIELKHNCGFAIG